MYVSSSMFNIVSCNLIWHNVYCCLSPPPGVVLAAHGHISTLLRHVDEHLHHNIRHLGWKTLRRDGRDGTTEQFIPVLLPLTWHFGRQVAIRPHSSSLLPAMLARWRLERFPRHCRQWCLPSIDATITFLIVYCWQQCSLGGAATIFGIGIDNVVRQVAGRPYSTSAVGSSVRLVVSWPHVTSFL